MAEPKYPIGIQTFSEIREGGYVYVDKTAFIPQLTTAGKFYFLSRPRRFGKSVFTTTLEAYFEGRRDLFKGLAIDSLDVDWEPKPVIHLDLNSKIYSTREDLLAILGFQLEGNEKKFGLTVRNGEDVDIRFARLILEVAEKIGKRVVILVDEYDKPLLAALESPELLEKYRVILKGFYGNLKSLERHISFAFITGVSRFSKVSIFSDLNNLNDISLDPQFALICGLTEHELVESFRTGILKMAEKHKKSFDETLAILKVNYDGYHFYPATPGLYNPFSVITALSKSIFGSYWFATGTPTFLAKMVKREDWYLPDLQDAEADIEGLRGVELALGNAVPILYQTGYLTIHGGDLEFNTVTLGYPNKEVKEGFLHLLLPTYADRPGLQSAVTVKRLVTACRRGDAEDFMERLQWLFANFPYEQVRKPECERHFQNVLYIVFSLMGFYTRMEYHTSSGRPDLVMRVNDYLYLFEFKFDRPVAEAMEQIERKRYADAFRLDLPEGHLIKIGASYSPSTNTIDYEIIRQ